MLARSLLLHHTAVACTVLYLLGHRPKLLISIIALSLTFKLNFCVVAEVELYHSGAVNESFIRIDGRANRMAC